MNDIIDPDPDFPNRPEHPHFWRISQIVIDNDSRSADDPWKSQGVPQVVQELKVDPESVSYMSLQRGMKVHDLDLKGQGLAPELMQLAKISSAWVDGFCAGVIYGRMYDD